MAKQIAATFAKGQRYVRGFYTGGTLCDEAMKLMIADLGHIYSNIPLNPADALEDPKGGQSREHTFLDFGDDAFTIGRPHPMIDPSSRAERVVADAKDPSCAVIMTDCVIGFGSHPNPAEDLANATERRRTKCAPEELFAAFARSAERRRPCKASAARNSNYQTRAQSLLEQRAGDALCSRILANLRQEDNMSKLNALFEKELHVVNFGIEAFYDDPVSQKAKDPECDLDYCANTARDMKIDVAVKNNFGFGGTNGTLACKRLS